MYYTYIYNMNYRIHNIYILYAMSVKNMSAAHAVGEIQRPNEWKRPRRRRPHYRYVQGVSHEDLLHHAWDNSAV